MLVVETIAKVRRAHFVQGKPIKQILAVAMTDGLAAVEAACAEALGNGVHSADVVLNILARRRDPEPPAPIPTPETLQLRCAPVADCARYDSLRSIH